ncbi:MAG: hypothetical protein EDX89_22615 [Acidobacteria bacterium]|nr:MAG: hypothetical protein EDX89_22615 [Acidobacteriota bacterium]
MTWTSFGPDDWAPESLGGEPYEPPLELLPVMEMVPLPALGVRSPIGRPANPEGVGVTEGGAFADFVATASMSPGVTDTVLPPARRRVTIRSCGLYGATTA